jgi:hypothetical protein
VNSGPEERPQPSGGRAPDEFDAIVAGWAREGSVPQWPDDDLLDDLLDELSDDVAHRARDRAADDTADDLVIDFDDVSGDVSGDVDGDVDGGGGRQRPPAPPAEPRTAAPLFTGPRDHQVPAGPEDEYYVPPEPPPLPRLGPPAIVGLVLLALGLILVLVPGWVGVGPAYGLPLGLLSLAAGLGWLVLRLWPDPPGATPPDGSDDGAVI